MRVPISWLREFVELPESETARAVADRLIRAGLEVEGVDEVGADVTGPLVVGRVLAYDDEEHSNGKTIRWCSVDVGEDEPRGIICGAHNFAVDDLVVVALPGAVLPGGFAITARKTYGHVSDGMICSQRELGLGDDHTGIIVLRAGEAKPGDEAAPILLLREDVLDIAVTPDRGYTMSIRGVAREAATAYDVPLKDPATGAINAPTDAGYPVRSEDLDGCPVFAAVGVTGFDPTAPSPRWLQRRLQLAGTRPISLGVDVTNYVMYELGQPIHGWDRAKLRGGIVVRRSQPGEKLLTLDGVTRELDPEDLVVTDDSGPIGLGGVMGGDSTELDPSTTEILVEAAYWDPVTIARTARRHKLPSEASKRFERGVDSSLQAHAARRVAELLVELGGGRIESESVFGTSLVPPTVTIAADHAANVAGYPIATDVSVKRLRDVGCTVVEQDVTLQVTPPSWRPDLTDPNDFAEEVIRLEGYEAVPSVLPVAPPGRGLTAWQRQHRLIGRRLAGAGYVEILAYPPFIGESDFDKLGLPADDPRRHALRLANPLSEETPLLRTSLLPGLLATLRRNVGRGATDVALFETGRVFRPSPGAQQVAPRLRVDQRPTDAELASLDAVLPAQPDRVAIVAAGERYATGWWGAGRPSTWADAIQAGRLVASSLGVTVDVRADDHAPWHPGRCAALLVDGRVVGHAGELHPKVVEAYGLPSRTVAMELQPDLLGALDTTVPAPDVSTFPPAKEDVALIVPASVPVADVEAALRVGAGDLLESVRLFDVYVGSQIPEGTRSLAFALQFRAPDRTLTDTDVSAAKQGAVDSAAQRTGAVQRGA